jgi:hypothetical protein
VACQGCTNIAVRPFGQRRTMMLEETLKERGVCSVPRMKSVSEIRGSGVDADETYSDDMLRGVQGNGTASMHSSSRLVHADMMLRHFK